MLHGAHPPTCVLLHQEAHGSLSGWQGGQAPNQPQHRVGPAHTLPFPFQSLLLVLLQPLLLLLLLALPLMRRVIRHGCGKARQVYPHGRLCLASCLLLLRR